MASTKKKKKPEPAVPIITDPILSRAEKLLSGKSSPAERDQAFNELAEMLVPVTSLVLRDDYVTQISKAHKIAAPLFRALIKQKEEIAQKRADEKKASEAVPSKPMPNSLHEYILFNETPGILWKAKRLLTGVDNPIERSNRVADICRTIALMPQQVAKDDYLKKICADYGLTRKTLDKLVADHTLIETKKTEITRTARKNTLAKLDSNPTTFPFFTEEFVINKDKTKRFKGIQVDIKKYLQFLLSFGFMRYGSDTGSKFNFIRMSENVLSEVNIEEIKDFLEDYLEKEYNYNGAGCEEVDADLLINFFLNNMKKYFTHDVFARLRSRTEIIISRDTEKECFLYFKNGFVRVTKEGAELVPYEKMDGSVWAKQMLDREFKLIPMQVTLNDDNAPDWENTFSTERPLGDYADFIWRISGMKQQRFLSLCTLIGYEIHDYYDYKLKAIVYTDSTVSENSEGRTGKTLKVQMLGNVRSYCEINGKQFNPEDERKYQYADLSTQLLHINDVQHKGRYKFDLESLFNDITEGYWVRKMFMAPFHKMSKIVISTNRSINVSGASMRDRIVEFEMSNFFSEHRSPASYYGKWMGKGWEEKDWCQFDNFICFCSQAFLIHGIIPPETINLEARKLLDGTSREFLEFMGDIADHIREKALPWDGYGTQTTFDSITVHDIRDFEFDKKQLFDRFIIQYSDFKANHFTQRKFTAWIELYARLALNIKTLTERRSNGISYFKFGRTTEPTEPTNP